MLRFLAGVAASLLLVAAGFFFWRSDAENEALVPRPPGSAQYISGVQRPSVEMPPSASDKTSEEKRFGRADKDKDGKISRAEMLQPRQKAFAKLDANGDGKLSFDEWVVKTAEKFASADADRSGWLSRTEYTATKPKAAPKKKCAC